MIKKSSPKKAKQDPKPRRLRLTKLTIKNLEPRNPSKVKGGWGNFTRACGGTGG